MQRHSIKRPEFNRLKSAIDLGLRTMRHPGAWAAATLAVGSGASAAPALERMHYVETKSLIARKRHADDEYGGVVGIVSLTNLVIKGTAAQNR